MTVELAMVISVVSVVYAIYKGVIETKRNDREEARTDATQLTTVIVKLEAIGTGIAEIKSEMSNMKFDVKENRERIIKVEESSKQAHKRLDTFEKIVRSVDENERGA